MSGDFDAFENVVEDAPQRLEFDLDSDTLSDIERAKTFHAKYSGDTERIIFKFSNYGKSFIKSCNMSPDSYVQMALQLAAFRTCGVPVAAVGAVSTRQFLLGRVDGIRATTEESVSFCQTFQNPLSTIAEKLTSLRKAVERYKQDAVLAENGLGVGRILLGLLMTSAENGIPVHPFLNRVGSVFRRPLLVASQMSLRADAVSFMNLKDAEAYRVLYNVLPDCITFGLSCSKSWRQTSAVNFKVTLERTLTEMRDIVQGDP